MATNEVEVRIGEWKSAPKNTKLDAPYVDTGIVIALSNLTSGVGYMGHFADGSMDPVRELLDAVRQGARHTGLIRVWYGGAAFVSPSTPSAGTTNREISSFRRRTANLLGECGFALQRTEWLRPGMWLHAQLFAGTSKCRLVPYTTTSY